MQAFGVPGPRLCADDQPPVASQSTTGVDGGGHGVFSDWQQRYGGKAKRVSQIAGGERVDWKHHAKAGAVYAEGEGRAELSCVRLDWITAELRMGTRAGCCRLIRRAHETREGGVRLIKERAAIREISIINRPIYVTPVPQDVALKSKRRELFATRN